MSHQVLLSRITCCTATCFVFTILNLLVIVISPAVGVDKTYQLNLNESWHLSSSWNPFGIPTSNDRAIIDADRVARLSSDTAGVDGLLLSNGGEVRTSGFQLLVDGGTSNAMTDILAGSRILVTPRTAGGPAFDTDSLSIHLFGLLDMVGGEVAIGNSLNISPNSTLAGDGLVSIFGTSSSKLFNRGLIRAEGGTLTIQSIGGGKLALDGSPNTTSVLEAIDGASTLVIDGILDDTFSDTLNIGAGNTIRFEKAWTTDETGTINFDASGGVGMLSGDQLTHRGTINVNSGAALISAPVGFESTSTVNLFDTDDILQIANTANIGSNATFTGNGRLINMSGSTLFTSDFADIDVTLENQGDLEIGDMAGPLEAEGFEQTSTGALEIELANISSGSFDVLTAQDNVSLAGTLDVSLLGGFTPMLGNSFTILETISGSVGGTFAVENVPSFNGLTLDVIYNSKSVVLEVVPSADFNQDGDVDGHDFVVWQRGGSPNGINSGDLAVWQSQYATPPPLAKSLQQDEIGRAVPEPTTGILLLEMSVLGLAPFASRKTRLMRRGERTGVL